MILIIFFVVFVWAFVMLILTYHNTTDKSPSTSDLRGYSVEEKALIDEGLRKLNLVAEADGERLRNEENRRQQDHNRRCPMCSNSAVVNKIANVNGKGEVHGSFSLGCGSVYGSSSVNTDEVNHCNNCGNQWKKYKPKYKYRHKYIEKAMVDIINNIYVETEGKYSFANGVLERYKDIPAESIYIAKQNVYKDIYISAQDNLTLDVLKTKYNSVKNKIK